MFYFKKHQYIKLFNKYFWVKMADEEYVLLNELFFNENEELTIKKHEESILIGNGYKKGEIQFDYKVMTKEEVIKALKEKR